MDLEWTFSPCKDVHMKNRTGLCLATTCLHIKMAHAGPDQPWNDGGGGGSGFVVGAILLVTALGLLKAFPLHVVIFGVACLVAWLVSLAVGDAAGLLVAVLLLVWLLRGRTDSDK